MNTGQQMPPPVDGLTPELFARHLEMVESITPLLGELTSQGITVIVESERSKTTSVPATDYILEFGDLRLRVFLDPGEQPPWMENEFAKRARGWLIEYPDADSLALCSGVESMEAVVIDSLSSEQAPHPQPIRKALGEYFVTNVLVAGFPDFRDLLVLPDVSDMEARLEEAIRAAFAQTAKSKVRIPEKIAALHSLSGADSAQMIRLAKAALDGHSDALTSFIEEPDSK